MDVYTGGPNVLEISFCVVLEVVADGNPDGPLPALAPVLVDDARNGPALAHAGSVANQEAGPVPVGQELVVLLRGVNDGFQLQGGQLALVDGLVRDAEVVVDVWGLNRGHGGRLDHGIGVGFADLGRREKKITFNTK